MGLYRKIIAAIASRVMQVGLAEDELFNALTGGQANETFSLRNADDARARVPVACWICWNLSWMVQRNHCELTITGGPIPWPNAIRAFSWISLMLALPYLIWRWPLIAGPIAAAVLAVDVLVYRAQRKAA